MSAALNNVTAPDTYTTASTLSCPSAARVRLQVNNQAIYWQRGFSSPGGGGVAFNEREEFLLPGLYVFEDRCDSVRVKAAIVSKSLPAGSSQAQVTIATRTAAEVGE